MKTHSKYSLVACCILALGFAPAAFAHDDETATFMKMDTDGDGYVSRMEANAAGEAKFNQADTNRDGIVTAAELDAQKDAMSDHKHSKMAKMSASDWIAKADGNNDGQLSRDEATAAGNAMFDKMDTNGDGKISKDECKAYHKGLKKTERNDKASD